MIWPIKNTAKCRVEISLFTLRDPAPLTHLQKRNTPHMYIRKRAVCIKDRQIRIPLWQIVKMSSCTFSTFYK